MGPKPDPTFPIDPYIGVKIGVDQKMGQTSGVLAVVNFSMGPQKYGVEGQYLVSDKKGKLVIKTDNILQMMGTSGELEVHLEGKWKSQKNKNSYLLDIKELTIPDFMEIGKRARIQVDTETGSSSHVESDIDFNGRLSYTKVGFQMSTSKLKSAFHYLNFSGNNANYDSGFSLALITQNDFENHQRSK